MYYKESGIKIEKKEKKHEGVKITNDIIQSSFIYAILGAPGCGKSTLIENLLKNPDLYRAKFNRVLFITPSKFSEIEMDTDNWYPTLNVTWIKERIREVNDDALDAKSKDPFNVLLILDDCISALNAMDAKPELIELFFNRRHIYPMVHVSIIITSQKWTMIPAKFRSILTGLFMFRIPQTDVDAIKKNIMINNAKALPIYLSAIWKKQYDFAYINFNSNLIYHNFDQLLI